MNELNEKLIIVECIKCWKTFIESKENEECPHCFMDFIRYMKELDK